MVQEMVGTARMDKGADGGGNDRQLRLAWAAGFIDGEGCILIVRATGKRGLQNEQSKRWYRIALQVANTRREPLQELVDLFGGYIFEKAVKPGYQPAAEWRAQAGHCRDVLTELLPFLRNKKPEADLALRFRAIQESEMGKRPLSDGQLQQREQMFTEMRKLKRVNEG
jgi:hypothetical protein